MKKICFLSLFLLLCVALDANALHWRLFHRHVGQPIPNLPFVHPPGIAFPPVFGGASPSIDVPREVVDQIKQSDKNLRDASTFLDPLIVKYKLGASAPAANANAPVPLGIGLQVLLPQERQDLIDILLGKKK